MRIAVAGGTGTVGHHVVEEVESAGHEVVALSRRRGVDVRNQVRLATALAGVDAVIDTLNVASVRRGPAEEFFKATSEALQACAADAGVRHLVTLSILGMEDVPGYGYYRAKLVQEQTMLAGPVGATVLRASQFFEFAAQMIALTRRGRFAVVPQMRSQPVAARTVARHLVRLAVEQPGGRHELAGPEVHEIPDVARRIAVARGERLHVVGVPFPGRAGRAMRNGALLARAGTEIDGPTLEDWLSAVWQKPDGGPDR